MNRQTFESAISATARVACAAALVGCVRTPPNAESGERLADSPSEASEMEVQECMEELATYADGKAWDRQIRDCCETVAVDWDFDNVEDPLRGMCCELLEWDGQNFPGCTPWGPPRPPSMGVRLSAARKVRAVRAAALQGVV